MIKFNSTNENIDWAKWTWNPITGCLHGCYYCYARDIANRFYEQGFSPTFHSDRLQAPYNTKIPKKRKKEEGIYNVFVCSMGDILGDWVIDEWINKIIGVMETSLNWNFILLTKNPRRYLEFSWPRNTWLGATTDIQKRLDEALDIFSEINHPIKFISCEPFLEYLNLPKQPSIEWAIIGAQTATTKAREKQPYWFWVTDLATQLYYNGIKVYFKPNLKVQPKELPEKKNVQP